MLHVYVKVSISYPSDDAYHPIINVWGAVLAPPHTARQIAPHLWIDEEDGRRFEYHGPVPVPGT